MYICPLSSLFSLVVCFGLFPALLCIDRAVPWKRRYPYQGETLGSLTRQLTHESHHILTISHSATLPHQASPHTLELSIISNKDSLNTSSIFTMTCPCSSCFASVPQYVPAQQHHQQRHPLPEKNVHSSGKSFAKLRRTRSIESTTSTLVGLTANAQPMAVSDEK
jgi:hypothetical protein